MLFKERYAQVYKERMEGMEPFKGSIAPGWVALVVPEAKYEDGFLETQYRKKEDLNRGIIVKVGEAPIYDGVKQELWEEIVEGAIFHLNPVAKKKLTIDGKDYFIVRMEELITVLHYL
jgi:co-chaperonin GroES (HSP10)